jgi:gamma-glutamyltranspeptidase/glutathione hydrolase
MRARLVVALILAFVFQAACGGGNPGPETTPGGAAAPGARTVRGARGGATRGVRGDAVVTGRPSIPADWAFTGKPVTATHAMVVSAHPLASQVGRDVLRQGGNAIDAAVAVGFALAVVLPEAGNIGGGGFIVYRDSTGKVRALDYREMAPSGASRDMYLDSAGHMTEARLTGHLASGVPGSVAGLYEAWKQYGGGRLSWDTLLAPAIRLAQGHMLDGYRSRSIEAEADRLTKFPASRSQFLVNGKAPTAGTTFKQPELARTLRLIADSGPDVFYRGQIADSIVAEMQRGNGLITKNDLKNYRAKWRTPIQVSYRGYTVYSMPPSSSGGVTMAEMLNIMEGYDTLPGFGSARSIHLEAEAMRRAFIDRNRWLGDPDFVSMPLERLLSKSYAAELRAQILPDRATPTPPVQSGGGSEEGSEETTHYSIVDAAGGAASVTTTLNGGFGSAVTVQGAGFLLNNEMDDFTGAPGVPNQYGLIQGEANAIAPKKRMLSAMTPSIVLDRDRQLFLVVGTPGGPTIINSVFQVIVNVVDHKMSVAEAVGAPRINQQALPDVIFYERGGLSPATLEALKAMGYTMRERGRQGDIMAIERSPNGAGWVGVPDPRHGGGASGW